MLFVIAQSSLFKYTALLFVVSSLSLLSWTQSAHDKYSTNWAPSFHEYGSGSDCRNPFQAPGFLELSPEKPIKNRWRAFDNETYPTPALLASFLRAAYETPDGFVAPTNDYAKQLGNEWAKEPSDPWGKAWEDMNWARGKTVLFVADSVLRYQTEWLCALAGGEYELITPNHRWWPWEDLKTVGEESHDHQKRGQDYHEPHSCYIPSLDFFILHAQTFGVDTEGFYREKEGDVYGPYEFEDRMKVIGKELMDSVIQKTGRERVDLLVLMTALWDSLRFNKDLMKAGIDPVNDLSETTVLGYKQRLQEITQRAFELFPKTPIMWQGTHYPIAPRNYMWTFDGEVKDGKLPGQSLSHLLPMSHAVKAVVDETRKSGAGDRIGYIPWGEIMMGTERFMLDGVHPAIFPSMPIWGDMFLYYLREVVSTRRR